MDLAVMTYDLAKGFPADERYGLRSQMQRAAVSVPTNIAEGKGRGSTREYAQVVAIARGSLMELETCVLLAVPIGYVGEQETQPLRALVSAINRMLNGLRRSLLPPERGR
jgi:four helix bundle protein